MENLHLLKKILTSESEYWVFERQHNDNRGYKFHEIVFGVVPWKFLELMPIKESEIMLSQIEDFYKSYIQNVFLTKDYAPFQTCVRMSGMAYGFPLSDNLDKNLFLEKALALDSKSLSDYQKLANELENAKEVENTTKYANE